MATKKVTTQIRDGIPSTNGRFRGTIVAWVPFVGSGEGLESIPSKHILSNDPSLVYDTQPLTPVYIHFTKKGFIFKSFGADIENTVAGTWYVI